MVDLLNKLKKDLQAAEKFEEDDFDIASRSRVRKSLAAVMNFLRDSGVETELTAPFQHLYAALEDIAAGRSNPLLEKATWEEGSKKLSFKGAQWSMAAAAMSILMSETGVGRENAAERVARHLGFTKQQLIDYRNNLTKNRLSDDERSNYDFFIKSRREEYKALSAEAFVSVMLEKGASLSEKR